MSGGSRNKYTCSPAGDLGGRSGGRHPGSKSEEFLKEFVKEMKTFQQGIWEGDLGGGTQAATVKTFFKCLLRN